MYPVGSQAIIKAHGRNGLVAAWYPNYPSLDNLVCTVQPPCRFANIYTQSYICLSGGTYEHLCIQEEYVFPYPEKFESTEHMIWYYSEKLKGAF